MNDGNESDKGKKTQKEIYKMYMEHVCAPKAQFFKDIGLAVVQGERKGIYIYTKEGKKKNQPPMQLIDCRTAGGTFNLGHQHPEMIKALKDGIEAGLDIGDHHMISEERARLARQLAHLMPPGITKTQFCSAGGEAVDLAIKLARGITKRKKVISAAGGYHGVTGVALAAGDPKFKQVFGWNLPEFEQVEFGNINSLERSIDENTAAVIFESIPATGGILIPPEGYFTSVREACDKVGAIMIQDEVQTGLGRTGQMWGIYGGLYPNEKVVPDIMVLAKGMSSGYYPLATCSYKPFIEDIFEEDPFIHISTTGGSELGCFVCRRMLDIITRGDILQNVKERGKELGEGLERMKESRSAIVEDVRGRGLMWGVEFINERYGLGYTLKMIENGIFADYCGNNEKVVKLMPPLVVTEKENAIITRQLSKAMDELPDPNV